MPRVGSAYEVPASGAHDQDASTGTAVIVSFVPPFGCNACFIQAVTIDCYITTDGSDPSSTNGLRIYAGQMPFYLPVGETIKAASVSASTTTINVLWLR